MAHANKTAMVDFLVGRFGPGNVSIDDTPLPAVDGDLPGVTRHRIRYLDEAGDSGHMAGATALQKPNGQWLMVNDVAARNASTAALVAWTTHNARPWKMVTEIRHNYERNSARIEAITNGNPDTVATYLVYPNGGSYASLKISDGAFS